MRFQEALRTGICGAVLAGVSMIAFRVEAQAYQRRLDPTLVGPAAELVNGLLAAVQSRDEMAFSRMVMPSAKLQGLGYPTAPLTLPGLRAFLDRCILKSSYFGSWQNGQRLGPLIYLECDFNRRGADIRAPVAMYIEIDQGRIRGISSDLDASPFR